MAASKQGLGHSLGTGIKLSKEWVECEISYHRSSKQAQQGSLRKKIFEHKNTFSRKKAQEINSTAQKKILEANIDSMYVSLHETSVRVFRTAYKLAKLGRPFVDFPVDIDVQRLNGLDMGRVLHSKLITFPRK